MGNPGRPVLGISTSLIRKDGAVPPDRASAGEAIRASSTAHWWTLLRYGRHGFARAPAYKVARYRHKPFPGPAQSELDRPFGLCNLTSLPLNANGRLSCPWTQKWGTTANHSGRAPSGTWCSRITPANHAIRRGPGGDVSFYPGIHHTRKTRPQRPAGNFPLFQKRNDATRESQPHL